MSRERPAGQRRHVLHAHREPRDHRAVVQGKVHEARHHRQLHANRDVAGETQNRRSDDPQRVRKFRWRRGAFRPGTGRQSRSGCHPTILSLNFFAVASARARFLRSRGSLGGPPPKGPNAIVILSAAKDLLSFNTPRRRTRKQILRRYAPQDDGQTARVERRRRRRPISAGEARGKTPSRLPLRTAPHNFRSTFSILGKIVLAPARKDFLCKTRDAADVSSRLSRWRSSPT